VCCLHSCYYVTVCFRYCSCWCWERQCKGTVTLFQCLAQTHTRLTALCPGLPGWAGTRKVKLIWILLKQEAVSGSGISGAICIMQVCISLQTTMSAPHHSAFLQAGCSSCLPINCVKAVSGSRSRKGSHVEWLLVVGLSDLNSLVVWCRWLHECH